MSKTTIPGSILSEYSLIPSNQMVIRRFLALDESYIKNFFEKGPHCYHIPEFKDDNEGLLGEPGWDDGFRAALAAASSRRNEEEIVDDEQFEESLDGFHEAVRHKHFASCWRLGTDESRDMWKNYTEDEEMVEGIAFETTVGQFVRSLPREPADPEFYDQPAIGELQETETKNMHIGAQWSDIRIGAVRYQNRDQKGVVQPAGYQAAINFFKRKKFDYEREFRLLINPFDSARLLLSKPDGTPLGLKPEVEEKSRFLPMDTVQMTNRIVLAPNGDKEQQKRLEWILDDLDIRYGSSSNKDLEIVHSTIEGAARGKTHPYEAEFGGQDNYDRTSEPLERWQQQFLNTTDIEWGTVDLIRIGRDPAGEMVEGYRYPSRNPSSSIDEYGHEEFQRVAGTRVQEYMNDEMLQAIEENKIAKISESSTAKWHYVDPPHCQHVRDSNLYLKTKTIKSNHIYKYDLCGICLDSRE